MNKIIRLITTF